MTQDASLHALYLFDVLPIDDPKLQETMRQVNDRLWVRAGIGGMARYEGDYYARARRHPKRARQPVDHLHAMEGPAADRERQNARRPPGAMRPAAMGEPVRPPPRGRCPNRSTRQLRPLTVARSPWSHSEVVETVLPAVARKRAEPP